MPIDDRKLSTEGWDGYYRTDKGNLIEMHEWEDWFDQDELEEGKEPDGVVYYDVFENGDVIDGGVIGYNEGDDIAYFNDWLSKAHDGRYGKVTDVVALETSEEFDEIEKKRYEGASSFARFCLKIGLKNKKTADRYRRKNDVRILARHLNEAACISDPYGYGDEFSSSETQGFVANEVGFDYFVDGLTNGDREFYRTVDRGLGNSITIEKDNSIRKELMQTRRELRKRRKQLFGRRS